MEEFGRLRPGFFKSFLELSNRIPDERHFGGYWGRLNPPESQRGLENRLADIKMQTKGENEEVRSEYRRLLFEKSPGLRIGQSSLGALPDDVGESDCSGVSTGSWGGFCRLTGRRRRSAGFWDENPVSAGFYVFRGLTPSGGQVPKEISPVSAATSAAAFPVLTRHLSSRNTLSKIWVTFSMRQRVYLTFGNIWDIIYCKWP
jgi:hypothetical protein